MINNYYYDNYYYYYDKANVVINVNIKIFNYSYLFV